MAALLGGTPPPSLLATPTFYDTWQPISEAGFLEVWLPSGWKEKGGRAGWRREAAGVQLASLS